MGLGYKALADDLEELIPNTPTSIGGLSHRLQHEGMPRTAAVIERLPAILSALRKAGEMEAALALLSGDHEVKPMSEERLDRLLDHQEHFRAVACDGMTATFQWSDQCALLDEAVLAFRARSALNGTST